VPTANINYNRVNPKRVTVTAAIVRYQTHGKNRYDSHRGYRYTVLTSAVIDKESRRVICPIELKLEIAFQSLLVPIQISGKKFELK